MFRDAGAHRGPRTTNDCYPPQEGAGGAGPGQVPPPEGVPGGAAAPAGGGPPIRGGVRAAAPRPRPSAEAGGGGAPAGPLKANYF
eukprot:1529184-Pyramimonas_sp.AAC.1